MQGDEDLWFAERTKLRDVNGLRESCPCLGHSLWDIVIDPSPNGMHGVRGVVKGLWTSRKSLCPSQNWRAPRNGMFWPGWVCPITVKAWWALALQPPWAESCRTGPQLMPAQCKPRLQRLFSLMCVTKHTKRIFFLRSSWEQNFFRKTCWCFGFAKDRSCFQAQTKGGCCDGPLLRQKKGIFLFPIFSSC